MKAPLRLRTRLVLTYTLLIVLGFGGLAWLAGGQIASAAQEDFAAALQAQTELVAHSLAEDMEHFLEGEESGQALTRRLSSFATQVGGPLLLLDARGHLLVDSHGRGAVGERVATPEVNAALTGRAAHAIRTDGTGQLSIFAAAPVTEGDELLGVVQSARPLSVAAAAVRQRWIALAAGVGVLGLLAVGASLLLASSLTRPLEALRVAALQLAAGDLDQRLPVMRQDEIGQVAAAFNTMAAEVQTRVEEQRAFAANASHELRTPLTTIRLRSEALRSGGLDPALSRQYIVEIDDEASRLSGLVEDLILLARLEAGRAVRGAEVIDVARVARGLIRELEKLPEAKGIALELRAPPDLPPLTTSIHHLRVLLRNLLSNALAYTPAGGCVTCTLRAEPTVLKIVVMDTGAGIAADDLPHVTERFYRADKAHTRAVKGSGLGLALVQSIVACYGGRMQVSSLGLGHGTTVEVWWPNETKPD